MSSRPLAVSTEWDESEGAVVVVVDAAFVDDAELEEISADVKAAREEGSDELWWLATALEVSEAELIGREMVRHAMIATVLVDVGIDRAFTWADDEEAGFVLRVMLPTKKGVVQAVTPATIAGALEVSMLCECGRRHQGGRIAEYADADGEASPLSIYALAAQKSGWKVAGAVVHCERCALSLAKGGEPLGDDDAGDG